MWQPSTLMARRAAVEPIEVVVRTAAAAAIPPESAAAAAPPTVAPAIAPTVPPTAIKTSPIILMLLYYAAHYCCATHRGVANKQKLKESYEYRHNSMGVIRSLHASRLRQVLPTIAPHLFTPPQTVYSLVQQTI